MLIGSQTYKRRFVKYEIEKSIQRRNGLLGIHINNIKGRDGKTKLLLGKNPLEGHQIKVKPEIPFLSDYETAASDYYKTYGSGLEQLLRPPYDIIAANIGDWVEEAARLARR